jgi:hypothetical protein
MRAHPTPMFPIITIGPFTKWGIDYTTCNHPSTRGHHYIIVSVDYFTKWVEAMPTFKDDEETTTLFLFNQIITIFVIPREIVTDHGNHFHKKNDDRVNVKAWVEVRTFITLLPISERSGGSCE